MKIWLHDAFELILSLKCFWKLTGALSYFWITEWSAAEFLRCLLQWLLEQKHTIKTQSEFTFDWIFPPPCDCAHYNIVKVQKMRTCKLLYLLCACDAIRTPLLSIICGVSVPHSARLQWGYFSQPSIQTWPITARLQKHFPCTQELTAVNGGYFQSLCCQSKCQVNTGQWKQL